MNCFASRGLICRSTHTPNYIISISHSCPVINKKARCARLHHTKSFQLFRIFCPAALVQFLIKQKSAPCAPPAHEMLSIIPCLSPRCPCAIFYKDKKARCVPTQNEKKREKHPRRSRNAFPMLFLILLPFQVARSCLRARLPAAQTMRIPRSPVRPARLRCSQSRRAQIRLPARQR